MITPEFLNQEQLLSRIIYGYYVDELLDSMLVNKVDVDQLYQDCLTVNVLMKSIHSMRVVGDEVFIGNHLIGDVYFKNAREKIREYLTYAIQDVDYPGVDMFSLHIDPSRAPSLVATIYSSSRTANGVQFKEGELGFNNNNYRDVSLHINSLGELIIESDENKTFSINTLGQLIMEEN